MTSILENYFKLDGGAMFGVIPKIMWNKLCPADENNLIRLDINPLLIKTPNETIIVDAGFGDVLNERQLKIYNLGGPTNWPDELKKNSVKPEDITAVIFTHLHADHAMGALKRESDGRLGLRFPNARYLVQKREWQDAMNPNERTAATYLVENLKLFEQSGKLELLDGDAELFPGISVMLLGGHTPGMQGVIIDAGGQRIIYPGDLMPMTAHMRTAYVAAVDLDPTTTIYRKRWLNEMMLKEDWIIGFDHDIDYKFAKFKDDGSGRIVPVKVD